MTDLNDQVLSTYLDGELDERARAEVEAALAHDAGARVRLERLRHADELLRKAIPEVSRSSEDPLARRILARDSSHEHRPLAEAAARGPKRAAVALVALAAGVSGLAIGIVGSGLLRGPANGRAPMLDDAVITALDTNGSGEKWASGERAINVVLTFRSTDGRYCRVFDVSSSTTLGEGIACRAGTEWQLTGWDATHEATGGYQPAGGNPVVDGMMERLGGKAALEPADERKLIEAKWRD